jgi:hypothetical protein
MGYSISEKDWQEDVEYFATLFGWKKYHTHDSRRSDPDFPDLIMVRRNRCIVTELKVDGKNPTPGQQGWLDAFKEAGAETYCWHPSEIEEVTRVLR